ncbi:TPA: UvrD-helicase domain-containing protein [Vibrio parahaemolyticus]|nr:UvrD-helicase domain-containing protein [Vibrio parahaemolyticus]
MLKLKNSHNYMILKTNFIGRLLGVESFSIENNTIYRNGKNGRSEYSLSNTNSFALLESSFFGSRINLKVDGRPIRIKYLAKKGSEEFLDQINNIISDQVTDYITPMFSEFSTNVIKHYPRDSWMEQIAELCQNLNDSYQAQPNEWKRYLSREHMERVEEITSFHPVDASKIRKYHETYQLSQREEFFDVVESNPLTKEQRLGVLRSNDRNMVLAAAGTGKTSVMVAKALDLIDRGLARPSEILVLAYNRAAADELKDRLSDKASKGNISLDSSPHISTFHALGRHLLREAGIPTNMSIFTEDDFALKQWVTSWIHSYISEDPSRIFDLIELSNPPINPFDFKSKAEYERYVRDNDFRTLNNEKVRGYQELLIANFLYVNQIPYKYEAPYVSKRRIDIGFDYKPDFYLSEADIYLEHFGIDRNGNTRVDIDKIAYNNGIEKKRELHIECGTTLIETFHYEWCEGTLLSGLKEKLTELGIVCNPMHPNDIFKKLNDQKALSSWSDLMTKALGAIRVERLEQAEILARFKKSKIQQPKKYSALLDALHQGYVKELQHQNAIDFDDMIIRAIQVVNDGEYQPKWKYVLVDEFQDISAARMEFIKSIISKGPKPSLTVVGDDWQSIYRFSGGKLELTTRFGEMIGLYSLTKLQKTFRYNNSIANTAGQFIMANPEQYEKHIETHTTVDESQVFLLDDKVGMQDGVYERVKEVVDKIRVYDADGSIAVIARYNYLLTDTRSVLSKERLTDNINFWSFHKSKGLEADYCILIGFFQGKSGFPNENRDDAIIEALLPSLDSYPHSEERRLLYVGITRAKKKCYIIANPSAPSDFITELLAPKYELNIASSAFQEQYRRIFKCPNCEDGYLRLVQGQYGEFYSCSSGLGCNVGKARVCSKCRAPSIDTRDASICNNPACNNRLKICSKCGRPMKKRQGKFGEFWGCSGYGINNDQCTNTSKL